jgi:catabolite regulation protein CreA
MFDGTELSLVYGDMQEPEIQQQQIQEPPQKIKQQPLTPQPEAMYQQQQPEPKIIYKEPQISFWDKLGQKVMYLNYSYLL